MIKILSMINFRCILIIDFHCVFLPQENRGQILGWWEDLLNWVSNGGGVRGRAHMGEAYNTATKLRD